MTDGLWGKGVYLGYSKCDKKMWCGEYTFDCVCGVGEIIQIKFIDLFEILSYQKL